jgi:S1-C subfamily serine protease
MNQKKYHQLVLGSFLVVLLIMFLGFFLTYTAFTQNDRDLASSIQFQLDSQIIRLEADAKSERILLEEQMLSNFKTLENTINHETGKIRLDLESQLDDVSSTFTEKNAELDSKITSLNVQSSDFSSIIDDIIKGVVSIKTNSGKGSGTIIDKEGYIITNKHVIEDASAIFVTDYQGIHYPVHIVSVATNLDLAIVKIESNNTFTALKFASDNDIKVGSKVIAVGNPLGLSFTVTEGIISSRSRIIDSQTYIQTDVSINPGNSGGPLINSEKRIIGINTLKIGNAEGIGFAIPSYIAQEMAIHAIE